MLPSGRLPILLLLAAGALTACAGSQPAPQDSFYRLPDATPGAGAEAPLNPGRLGVQRLSSDGLYHERPILYIDSRQPNEIRRYHYHHWASSPPDLVREHLLVYLRGFAGGGKVERYVPGEDFDAVLGGRLQRFERVLDGTGVEAIVQIEFDFRRADGFRFSRTYLERHAAPGATIHDSVQAFSEALQAIYERFTAELAEQSRT